MPNISKAIDSLYLHFPFCAHLCNYCDFYKKVPKDKKTEIENFHRYLASSWEQHESLIKKNGYSWAALKTLYIGGGTPSFWGKEGAQFLESFLHEHDIKLSPDCEFTLEVNPGVWDEESIKAWQKLGANRFSLGLQSLNPDMLKNLNRVHSLEDAYQALAYFQKNKLNYSVDFMLGLPFSNEGKRNILAELEEVLSYGPSHFSVYILTVKENYVFYKNLPDEEWIENEFMEVADFLTRKGYLHYEVSNFALAGKESLHNLNYWRSHTVAAFGPSATGLLAENKLRYKWESHAAQYRPESLTEEQFRLEKIYMSLRSKLGLKLSEFDSGIFTLAKKWQEKNWAYLSDDTLYLTSRGYLLIDSIMDDLFALKLL